MKTILISGGAGYLGTELTINLLRNYKVIVYDVLYFPWLLKNKKKIKNNKNLKFIKKNINDVKKKDLNGVDIVCDLNGISNDPSSEINSKHTWKINYFGRLKFAEIRLGYLDIFLILHVLFMALIGKKFLKTQKKIQ